MKSDENLDMCHCASMSCICDKLTPAPDTAQYRVQMLQLIYNGPAYGSSAVMLTVDCCQIGAQSSLLFVLYVSRSVHW